MTTNYDDSLAWRKRLWFRSHHRGQRELDILFARFADTILPSLEQSRQAEYQFLLDIPDNELLSWVLGTATPPKDVPALVQEFIRYARKHKDDPQDS